MDGRLVGPCAHCGSTQSPLWRPGPDWAPVLCNACGTQWRTRRTLDGYLPVAVSGFAPSSRPRSRPAPAVKPAPRLFDPDAPRGPALYDLPALVDGPRKRKASSRLLHETEADAEPEAVAAAPAPSRPRPSRPRPSKPRGGGGAPQLQLAGPFAAYQGHATPPRPPRSSSPQAAPAPRLPASFVLAAQWPSPPWGLPPLPRAPGDALGAAAVSPVACWPDAFVAQWQRPALAAARSPQTGGLLPSMGDGAPERSPLPGLYGWEPLHVFQRPAPRPAPAAQPARKKSRSGSSRSGAPRRKPPVAGPLPLGEAGGADGFAAAPMPVAKAPRPRSRASRPRSRAPRLPPPPPPFFGANGELLPRPAQPDVDTAPAAGARVRGSRAPRARRATAPRLRACAPPPPPPPPPPAAVYDAFPPYNRQTVLRSQQSPLCDPLVDIAALLAAALGGGALNASDVAQLLPLLPPAEQSAAAAGAQTGPLLAATVKAPAFCAAARDFSRLLVAGSWDPNAPRAGARMLDHYKRLLNEPALRVALWATQRPAMGTRSRGAPQPGAAAAVSPVVAAAPAQQQRPLDQAPATAEAEMQQPEAQEPARRARR